ncbi:type II toxin-antitoxin system RelE family toxin [Nocardia ignorata]|uniref:type II toxin-antitoxin system RelE family toxin n=1 Tax=Nocardia ignorata TaxID=145285 RepID=UPI001FB5801D|nr:type II toxin-antitoxin system RelE/ParE family toxin [Nocardia ignorata]
MADSYRIQYTPAARRALSMKLPEPVAAAAWELINGDLAANPWRVGKALHEPYTGLHSARRGTYRIIYRIDDTHRLVVIHDVEHRRDIYR